MSGRLLAIARREKSRAATEELTVRSGDTISWEAAE